MKCTTRALGIPGWAALVLIGLIPGHLFAQTSSSEESLAIEPIRVEPIRVESLTVESIDGAAPDGSALDPDAAELDQEAAFALLATLGESLDTEAERLRQQRPEVFEVSRAYQVIAERLDLDPTELAAGRVGDWTLDPTIDAAQVLGSMAANIEQAVDGNQTILGMARNEILERGAFQGHGFLLAEEHDRLVIEVEAFRRAFAQLDPQLGELLELLVDAVPLGLRVSQLRAANPSDPIALGDAEMALISHQGRLFEASSAIYRTALEAPLVTPLKRRDANETVTVRF